MIKYYDIIDLLDVEDSNILTEKLAINLVENKLKRDFLLKYKTSGFVSSLTFDLFGVKKINLKGEEYFEISVEEGKISNIIKSENETTFTDAKLSNSDLKKLKCMININTREYKYLG